MNLVSNAKHATGGSGLVTITLFRHGVDGDQGSPSLDNQLCRPSVRIDLDDTGSGMSDEVPGQYLAARPRDDRRGPRRRPGGDPEGRRERILVVDDDPAMRAAMVSGYPIRRPSEAADLVSERPVTRLQKPFSSRQLAAGMHTALTPY